MTRPPLMTAIALSVALLVTGCASSAPAAPPAGSSTTPGQTATLAKPAEFEAAAAAQNRLLINVHTPPEGQLQGTALTIPFEDIASRSGELPTDLATPLAVYCKTGRMSAIAVVTLAKLGYTDIVELDGGMDAWAASGRSILASPAN